MMRKHAAATDAVRTVGTLDSDVVRVATKAWEDCLASVQRMAGGTLRQACWLRPAPSDS